MTSSRTPHSRHRTHLISHRSRSWVLGSSRHHLLKKPTHYPTFLARQNCTLLRRWVQGSDGRPYHYSAPSLQGKSIKKKYIYICMVSLHFALKPLDCSVTTVPHKTSFVRSSEIRSASSRMENIQPPVDTLVHVNPLHENVYMSKKCIAFVL